VQSPTAGVDPVRLIRLYLGRACFKIGTAFAMLGKWLAGI
jgi:hypothetical protein